MLLSRSSCDVCCRAAIASQRSRILSIRRSLATATSQSTALEVTDPFVLYQNLVASGRIKWDEEQVRLLVQLKHVHQTLVNYEPSPSLRWLLESTSMKEQVAPTYGDAAVLPARILPSFLGERSLVKALTNEDDLSMLDSPTGFMLTGSVGTGKTMLLDLFYNSLPVKKQRIHYHAFLLGLYRKVFVALEEQRVQLEGEEQEMQRLAGEDISQGYPWSRKEENKAKALTKGWRQVFASGRKFDDPKLVKEYVLARVALDLIKNATVMAFDEVQLVDIAGAGIIRRVLTWYWRLGGVVIATSNRLPSDLYQHGIQQDQFQTFLTHLQERCPVYELRSPNDWRRRDRASHLGFEDAEQVPWVSNFEGTTTWFTDAAQFASLADQAIDTETAKPKTLSVYGRKLHVPYAVEGDVARLRFGDLCHKELGPADFLTITSTYPTIIIEDIPQLKLNAKNEARRFITFLDAAYEAKTRLICLAAAEPDQIFFPDAASLLEAMQGGDSMVQETLGEISQDLAESFRPNISSYKEELSAVETRGEAARAAAQSAGKPAFSNLAIFTGQDEQFAYKRALSRIFEITSREFVKTARHTPIPYEERVWEHPKPTKATVGRSATPIRPDPTADQEDRSMLPPRGVKVDPLDPSIDPYQLPKPTIRSTHVWGMIDNWGRKSGLWGLGVRAPGLTDHETRRNEQQERWKMIQADRATEKPQEK